MVLNFNANRCVFRRGRRGPNDRSYTLDELKAIAVSRDIITSGLETKQKLCKLITNNNQRNARLLRLAQDAARGQAQERRQMQNQVAPPAPAPAPVPVPVVLQNNLVNGQPYDHRKCVGGRGGYTLATLKRYAKSLGIKRVSGLSKERLCASIREQRNARGRPIRQLQYDPNNVRNIPRIIANHYGLTHEIIRSILNKLQSGATLTNVDRAYITRYQAAFQNANRLQTNQIMLRTAAQYQAPAQPLAPPRTNWKPTVGNMRLHFNVNMKDPISMNIPNFNNMYYLTPDVNQGIRQVYTLNTLKNVLKERNVSPITRKKITSWNNVKKVKNDLYIAGVHKIALIEEHADMQSKVLKRIKDFLLKMHNVPDKLRFPNLVPCHAHTKSDVASIHGGCAGRLDELFEFLKSKTPTEAKKLLKDLDTGNPICIEAHCNYLGDFIKMKQNKFNFEHNSRAGIMTNCASAANAIAQQICREAKSGPEYIEYMRGLPARMQAILLGKNTTEGKIKSIDIFQFLINYGEYLLNCDTRKNFLNTLNRRYTAQFYNNDGQLNLRKFFYLQGMV